MSYVICINAEHCSGLTDGNTYPLIEKKAAQGYVFVKNDIGKISAYHASRFAKPFKI